MPATLERLILDPSEAINNRTAVDISDWIDFEGADYGAWTATGTAFGSSSR